MSLWEKVKNAVIESEAPKVTAQAQAPTPPLVGGPVSYQYSAGASVGASDVIFSALFSNINNGVSPNNLLTLMDMADTMKSAILDEGTRIKAASAALKLTFADVNATIDALLSALQKEKDGFYATDVAVMDQEVARLNADVEQTKAEIDDLVLRLNAATAKRDELTAQSNQKQDEKTITVSTFEATVTKVIAELENERRKAQIYVPQGVI